jgi:hypothetical protein
MLSFAQHLTFSWHAVALDVLEFIGFIVMSTALRAGIFKLRFFLFKRKIRRALSAHVPASWIDRAEGLLTTDSDPLRNLAKAPSQAIKSFLTTLGK